MREKEITKKIKIFDDPEFCEDGENHICKQIRSTLEHCSAFIDRSAGEPFPVKLEYNEEESKAVKCDKCKAAYEAAQ